MLIFPTISAFFTGIIMLAIAGAVFGVHIASSAPVAIPVGLLGGVAFAPLTLLLVSTVVVVKQAAMGSQFVIAGISIVGGLYFPITELPKWLHWAANVQPFTPAADLMRHLLVDTPMQYSVVSDLLRLAGSPLS